MDKKLFWILFILLPINAFSQEYLQVNTKYNEVEKEKELTVEIVNKSNKEIGIPNAFMGRFVSYFELYFFDKNGQQLSVSYPPESFGIPFCNGLDIPKTLSIKPYSSLMFIYSIESLFRYCKEQDKIKGMKLKFHIKYYVIKDDSIAKQDVYEAFSKAISF